MMDKTIWIVAVMLINLISSSTAQEIDLEDEQIAFYPLAGNALNQVEDNNHGIETNVTYAEDRFGNPGGCCYLSGNNSFITIPHTEELNWDARTESYSIVFWFKSDDPLSGETSGRRILTKWSEYPHLDPYPFSFQVGKTQIIVAIREQNTPSVFVTCENVFDNQWHMIAMIYDHSIQMLSVYLDNQLIDSENANLTKTTSNSVDILIGKLPVIDLYYKGAFDDLYFYNRALNLCEVEALYTGDLLYER